MKAITSRLLLAATVSAFTLSAGMTMAGEVVWWTPNWGQARAEKLAADFMKANPDITIKMEITTSNGLPQRVLTALQSGALDAMFETYTALKPMVDSCRMRPLASTGARRSVYLPNLATVK